MKPKCYLFDKRIYQYTKIEHGVEIRRKDGQDIDISGNLQPDGMPDYVWNDDSDPDAWGDGDDLWGSEITDEGTLVNRPIDNKEGYDFKTHTIWSRHYEVIDDVESHIDNDDVFIVIDYD